MVQGWLVTLCVGGMVALLCAVLYQNGWGILSCKMAQSYIEAPRIGKNKNRIRVHFTRCNGTTRRVIRLPASQTVRFTLDAVLTRGALSVELLDRQGQSLAVLDGEHPTATLETDPEIRYRVVTRFEHADGSYTLTWQAV